MKWNWELKDWPNFTFNSKLVEAYEHQFLENAGAIQGSLKHLDGSEQSSFKIELISSEAFKTSEIEGEILNRESLQSSIRKHFGLKTNHQKSAKEEGIAEMMVDLYTNFKNPLDHEKLFLWHKMLTNGRRDLISIGEYRTHEDAMQIVSGAFENLKVHFEAPPSNIVNREMDKFISWFNDKNNLSPLLHAAISHLYFESIHPFEDGNGRIGRAISELSLSQSLDRPTLTSMAFIIEKRKKEYYEALHHNSKKLEIDNWIEFFCKIILEAQEHSQSLIEFLIKKNKFYYRYSKELNTRQEKVIERIFREGLNGFKGGLSAENYISITGAPRATVTRDLQNLVSKNILLKTGERKSTRYYLNLDVLLEQAE